MPYRVPTTGGCWFSTESRCHTGNMQPAVAGFVKDMMPCRIRPTEHGRHVEKHLREMGCHWTTLPGCVLYLIGCITYVWPIKSEGPTVQDCILYLTDCSTYDMVVYSRVWSIEGKVRLSLLYITVTFTTKKLGGTMSFRLSTQFSHHKTVSIVNVLPDCLLIFFSTDRTAGVICILTYFISHWTHCRKLRDVTATLASIVRTENNEEWGIYVPTSIMYEISRKVTTISSSWKSDANVRSQIVAYLNSVSVGNERG